jgi:hypothetical protein
MTEDGQRCGNCHFWREHGGWRLYGVETAHPVLSTACCYAAPPTTDPGRSSGPGTVVGLGVFPVTRQDWWCGHWRARSPSGQWRMVEVTSSTRFTSCRRRKVR